MTGSSSCLPAWEAFPRSSSLLRFLLSRTDECTGNGGPAGLFEHSATMGRLVLVGLLGLEGDALGSSALLARDRDNQLFLGLGRRRVRAETAHGTVDRLGFGEGGRDSSVNNSCSRRRRQENPCRTSRNLLAGACTRSCTISGRLSSRGSLAEPGLCRRRRELAPRELSLLCSRRSTQDELVLGVPLPRSHRRLVVLASEL